VISWIGVPLSILLRFDIVRRTKWVSHPEYGILRLTLGLGVTLTGFLSFDALLSTQKRSVAESTAGQTAGRQTIAPHETQVITQNSARPMHRPPHRNKLARNHNQRRKRALRLGWNRQYPETRRRPIHVSLTSSYIPKQAT